MRDTKVKTDRSDRRGRMCGHATQAVKRLRVATYAQAFHPCLSIIYV